MRRDWFGATMLGLVLLMTFVSLVSQYQRDEARVRTRALCGDLVTGLERELLRDDVDSTEAGLVLGATWQATRNCFLDLEVDARFVDDLHSGDARLRRSVLRLVRERLED